ncbi:phosphatidylinositol-3-phosphate-binding protein bem1 [Gigaspora margarita]|uniref:Phosphatidylinositol-3-phosphate-binding protein bem1 n=1 Tax=Gigaspora margarita TaxID=4874 RepID=A0A8H4A0F7_GIGMA|nr:phosphatidylinositol-3-phosphate-binding protein bem1 [Gigaspora margarita]
MVKVSKSLKPTLDFRRSVSKDKISTPIATKAPPPSILPPKKVIKALYDYTANGPNELSFSKGDFFHVVGNENDPNWYDACNPATNVRGLVPVSYFQVLEKSGRSIVDDKVDSGPNLDVQKPQPLYGIVLYDFVAERPDELDAKAGEPIIVIAQSNHEWFVAKPIGRLGGPGLIPVAFIEIRDHATGKAIDNIQELMDKSVVPKVEEWKKMTKDYQENSISLGRIDPKLAPIGIDPKLAPMALVDQQLASTPLDYDPKLAPVSLDYDQNSNSISPDYDQKLAPVQSNYDQSLDPISFDNNNNNNNNNNYNNNNSNSSGLHDSAPLEYYDYSQEEPFDTSADIVPNNSEQQFNNYDNYDSGTVPNDEDIISASVESFHYEDGRYWFLVRVELFSGCFRLLYRLYEDFYEFQIALLEKFPDEAGRNGDQRILPFMPGPLSYVNDVITAQRRADLDVYVKELLRLPSYILKDPLLDQLFGLRDGDIETPSDPRQPTGVNGDPSMDPSDDDPLPPMLTYPVNHSSVTSQQTKKSGGNYNKHNTSSSISSTTQSFIKSSRVHDESSNSNSILFSPTTPQSDGKQTFMKIKISYKDDKIAIRVPSDVTFAQLREKICDRLGEKVSSLSYRDERTNEINPIEDDDDLNNALDSCPKLLIYAA